MKHESKYDKALKEAASYLDAVTQSEGKIIKCAESIISNMDQDSVISICKYIDLSRDFKDNKITQIAIALKDCLIQFLGYYQILDICNKSQEESEIDKCSFDELMFQLNHLIGLQNVKAKVNELIAYQKVQLLRNAAGLHSPKGTMHIAFIGNPGTGKTTVARIIGRMYKSLGLLSKGHFTEVSRTNLIAGYQGQTALKVKEVIEKAKGGVLFIDEAYSITENDHADSYGRECLTELTKALEDYRDDLVVIVAGYKKLMEQFFESNPGLKSRFNTFIEFDDYSTSELIEILKSICSQEDYILTPELEEKLINDFEKNQPNKNDNFSNGRYIRNIFENMVRSHAVRIQNIAHPTVEDLKDLKIEDYVI